MLPLSEEGTSLESLNLANFRCHSHLQESSLQSLNSAGCPAPAEADSSRIVLNMAGHDLLHIYRADD